MYTSETTPSGERLRMFAKRRALALSNPNQEREGARKNLSVVRFDGRGGLNALDFVEGSLVKNRYRVRFSEKDDDTKRENEITSPLY